MAVSAPLSTVYISIYCWCTYQWLLLILVGLRSCSENNKASVFFIYKYITLAVAHLRRILDHVMYVNTF